MPQLSRSKACWKLLESTLLTAEALLVNPEPPEEMLPPLSDARNDTCDLREEDTCLVLKALEKLTLTIHKLVARLNNPLASRPHRRYQHMLEICFKRSECLM
jgi:hypothetical protein